MSECVCVCVLSELGSESGSPVIFTAPRAVDYLGQ